MDARQRQIFDKAHAMLDRRDDDAREHREWLEQHYDPATERVDLGEDAPPPAPSEMVCKTFATPPPTQQMDAATEAAWNLWAERKIDNALHDHIENFLKDFIAEVLVLERQSMREELSVKGSNVELIKRNQNVG